LSPDRALNEMQDMPGTPFDPRLLAAFRSVID
jgi:HD-GYP domain-containing protein (c-di-GMP phosphodiesterase class II)